MIKGTLTAAVRVCYLLNEYRDDNIANIVPNKSFLLPMRKRISNGGYPRNVVHADIV